MKGQEHIVRALRGAVANDRIVHAYLFSGPRGTGKTTTARILAKALNCENPVDGDACNQCASCVAITKGASLDVVELDAASNNGVDDIREIIAGAWHGTPGRWKVYIIDEVHMLSKNAEAAFLKTLEEPPGHVVFVLATTDPHKVVATIRSRTQHLEFRLFDAATLSALLHEVRDAAGLTLDEATLSAAVRMGRGSARDALSALDQVLATGSLGDAAPPFDDLLGALASSDAVGTLGALAVLGRLGWDPEQLGESFAGELRQIFLLQVAPEVSDALDIDRDRLTEWGNQLGLARTVRALETVGRTLREMKSSPVPIVMLEVALVRLTRPELDDTVSALDERLSRLERAASAPSTAATGSAPSPPRPIGSLARATTSARDVPAKGPSEVPAASVSAGEKEAEPVSQSDVASLDVNLSFTDFVDRFTTRVLPKLSRAAQLLLGTAQLHSLHGALLTIIVPSESLRSNADKVQSGLKSALEHEFGSPIQVTWKVDPSMQAPVNPVTILETIDGPVDQGAQSDEMGDDEIAESAPLGASSVASLLINEAFPGAEEIQ